MAGKSTLTFYDARGRATSMSMNIDEPNGSNTTALTAAQDALAGAVLAISESAEYSATLSRIASVGTPADRGGLRGTKALIRWFSEDEGDGGQYGSNEIGAVDPDLFTVVGDRQILQGTPYTNLKAAFDAHAQTENGNSVAVYEVELVSRGV